MFNIFKKKKRTKARILVISSFQDEIVEKKRPALVTFSAAWCGACKMQKPLINDLADHHRDKNLVIGFVDIDSQTELSRQFAVQSIPTTLVFKDGEVIFRKTGLLSRGNLENLVQEINKTSP